MNAVSGTASSKPITPTASPEENPHGRRHRPDTHASGNEFGMRRFADTTCRKRMVRVMTIYGPCAELKSAAAKGSASAAISPRNGSRFKSRWRFREERRPSRQHAIRPAWWPRPSRADDKVAATKPRIIWFRFVMNRAASILNRRGHPSGWPFVLRAEHEKR